MTTNLIIAHNLEIFREILKRILQSYQGLHIVSQVDTTTGLLRAVKALKPDIIIMDTELSGTENFTALQKIIAKVSPVKVILSWPRHQQVAIPKALSMGCVGCIIHDAQPTQYHVAIKQILKGNTFYCSETQKLIDAYKNRQNGVHIPTQKLSIKEAIILYSLYMSYTNKGIAMSADLTENSAKTYRKRIKKKIGSTSFLALEYLLKDNGFL
jgi:DNA-binding NarL/FixJ family response regulator